MSDLPFMTSKTLPSKRWQYSYLAFFAHGYSPRVHFAARAPLRSSRAALVNASRFLSSAPWRVRIPLHWAQKGKAPIAGSLFNQVVGDEGCRVRLRRPLPLRACGPRVLRWKTLARFLSSAPWRVRIPLRWAQTKTVPFRGPFPIQWWAMRDVRVRLVPPAPRFVAPLLACCAGKRFAFPQLRTLAGSNPSALGPKRKGPHRWEPFQSSGGR